MKLLCHCVVYRCRGNQVRVYRQQWPSSDVCYGEINAATSWQSLLLDVKIPRRP